MSTQLEKPVSLAVQKRLETIRLLVVDDQRLFRESVAGMLQAEPFFEVVGLAGNGLEALELARKVCPDVVLMDVKMPMVDGIAATRYFKAEMPRVRVILLTTFDTDTHIFAGLTAGAAGYLLKDTSTAGLISAIRAVHAGEQVTTSGITHRMMRLLERPHTEHAAQIDGLTTRERETLMLIARGLVAKEIARALNISEKTVRNHISNIYRKLDIYDRSQLVIYALKKGLVDLQDV